MKLATKFAVVLGASALLISNPLVAGETMDFKEKKVIETPEPTQWWNAALSTGWDSLYMFRGVNVIPGFDNYGSSLYWTDLSVTFNLTSNDFLTIGSWVAFGLTETNYKEFDGYASYTHTFGDLSLSLGYTYYQLMNTTFGLYSHELSAGVGYDIHLGPVTITPGVNYYFNLGPKPGQRGFVEQAASYLEFRIDGNVPIYKDVVALTPWTAFGTNFRYNLTEKSDPPSPFTGGNNFELGLALPITLSKVVSISPYGAYSYQWNDLPGTKTNTFWGGGSVTFSF